MESRTANKKTEEHILDRAVSEGFVSSCSIVSRTGLLVSADSMSPQKKDTFAAMAAIVFSAAEAVKSDVKDGRVGNIVASFETRKMILLPVSSNYILVGVLDDPGATENALKSMEETASKLRKEAPWLN